MTRADYKGSAYLHPPTRPKHLLESLPSLRTSGGCEMQVRKGRGHVQRHIAAPVELQAPAAGEQDKGNCLTAPFQVIKAAL